LIGIKKYHDIALSLCGFKFPDTLFYVGVVSGENKKGFSTIVVNVRSAKTFRY